MGQMLSVSSDGALCIVPRPHRPSRTPAAVQLRAILALYSGHWRTRQYADPSVYCCLAHTFPLLMCSLLSSNPLSGRALRACLWWVHSTCAFLHNPIWRMAQSGLPIGEDVHDKGRPTEMLVDDNNTTTKGEPNGPTI